MKRIANRDARPYVQARKQFHGSNLYSSTVRALYVVYSYGDHWPLFVYDPHSRTWFEHEGRYSVSTSRHRSQAHPHPHCATVLVPLDILQCMLNRPMDGGGADT